MAAKKTAKKVVQYYKVVDTKNGHHGFHYKVGMNVDPDDRPIEDVISCGAGALYFVTGNKLGSWAGKGDSIAWITPKSRVVRDDDKFKCKTLEVTKILPIKDALPLIRELSVTDYERFGVKITESMLNSLRFSAAERVDWFLNNSSGCVVSNKVFKILLEIFKKNRNNKEIAKSLENEAIEFTVNQVKILLENKLYEYIPTDTVREFLWNNKNSVLLLIMKKMPEEFLKKVLKLI